MTAPVVIGAPTTFAAATSGNTIVLSRPSGVQAGDLLVAALRTMGSTSPSDFAADGWTRRGYTFIPNDSGGRVTGLFTHPVVDVSSEPASYVFTKTVADARRVGAMFVVRGVDLTNPVVGQSVTWTAVDTTVTIPSYPLDTTDATLEVYLWGTEVVSPNSSTPTSSPGGELVLVASSAGTGATRSTAWVGCRTLNVGTGGGVALTWASVSGSGATAVTLRGIPAAPPTDAIGAVTLGGVAERSINIANSGVGVVAVGGSATATIAVSRTAVGTLSVDGDATRAVAMARDAVAEVALDGTGMSGVGVFRDAAGVIGLTGVGVLPGPQAPTTRTLTGTPVSHELTGTPVHRTLEVA